MADQKTTVAYSPKKETNIPDEESQSPHIGFILPNAPNPQQIAPSSAPPSYETPPPYNPTYQPGQSVTHQGARRTLTTWVPYRGATNRQKAIGIGVMVSVFLLVSTVITVVFFVQKNRAQEEFRKGTNWNDDFFPNH